MTCAWVKGVSCGQYDGKTGECVATSVFEQANICSCNQQLAKNEPNISTGLFTNFVCNFCVFFRQILAVLKLQLCRIEICCRYEHLHFGSQHPWPRARYGRASKLLNQMGTHE
jgi:hypothetical protein